MKKKYIQSCELGGSIYGKTRQTNKAASASNSKVTKKDLMQVYNQFFKSQASALYDAVNKSR